MSAGKDLRQEFSQPEESAIDHAAVSRMLGITAANMLETISTDIAFMIDNGRRDTLEGYIFCLSRIMSHKMAWRCISETFAEKEETVPDDYRSLFGQTDPPTKSTMTVNQ